MSDIEIKEGIRCKGGVNPFPTTPKPDVRPCASRPQSNVSNYINIDLSEEQVKVILRALDAGETEGQVTKEEMVELYYALGHGDDERIEDM